MDNIEQEKIYINFLKNLYRLGWFVEDYEEVIYSSENFEEWINYYYFKGIPNIETKKDFKRQVYKLYKGKVLDQTLNYMTFDEWFEDRFKSLLFSHEKDLLT